MAIITPSGNPRSPVRPGFILDHVRSSVDTSSWESCSKGVDCSGFVSNVWELGHKYGTCSLKYVTCKLDATDDLKAGDILNDCSNHVVLYRYQGSGGVYAYESTKNHSYDRVVYDWEPWSRYNGYEPRRYEESCEGCPADP